MKASLKEFFSFPDPVNESAARVVAGGVSLMAFAYMVWGTSILLWILVYGFLARVLAGPRLSPLGLLATRVAALHLPLKYCPGPPKRFAQAIGLTFSSLALVLSLAGHEGWSMTLIGMLLVAALLESVMGICLGCKIFALLMKLGVIPDEVCERCNNIWGENNV